MDGRQAMLLSLYVGLVLGAVCTPVHCTLTVTVNGITGVDSDQCLVPNSSQKCKTLSFVADQLSQKDLKHMVEIVIEGEVLDLRRGVEFSGYSELSIYGSSTTVNCAGSSGAGLAFVDVQGLRLHSLSVEGCGTERNSTSVNPHSPNQTECLRVAVYILNCTNISIDRVNIRSSNGTGVSLYDTGGTVEITDCQFTANRLEHGEESLGGGGVHIEFTLCPPGHVGKCPGRETPVNSSNYTIQNCSFSNNSVTVPQNHTLTPLTKVGKGGGLYVSIGSTAFSINFTIKGCVFHNNSADYWGGGMLVEFLSLVQGNVINVSNSTFSENVCLNGTGGGLTIGILLKTNAEKLYINNFLCTNCSFDANRAYAGGGVALFTTKTPLNSAKNAVIFFRSNWTSNKAPVGAALYASPDVWDFAEQGYMPTPLFINCSFQNNSAHQQLASVGVNISASSVGLGVVFASELHIGFEGNTLFLEGTGSALYLSNSVVEFGEWSNVTFHSNKGHNGGAVAMYGSSTFRISNNSLFQFTDNFAYFSGGAIYINVPSSLQVPLRNCFIESLSLDYPKTNSVLKFSGNTGFTHNHAIFANSFQPCLSTCPNAANVSKSSLGDILNCTVTFLVNSSLIGTLPAKFSLSNSTVSSLMLQPGIPYHLSLLATDEAGTSLEGVNYYATVYKSQVLTVKPLVANNTVTVYGKSGANGTLYLDTDSISLRFNITLDDCQPGYTFTEVDGVGSCVCAASRYLGLTGCNPTEVYLEHGFWMGYCSRESKKLCTVYCPTGYCSYHKMKPRARLHPLPNSASELDSSICGPHRTGQMCSECVDNRSVFFHSIKYTCGPEHLCYLGWLFYLLFEIFPLTIIFILILVLNITFTSGHLNSFVLFAQILDSLKITMNGLAKYPKHLLVIQGTFTFFYQFFNLNFFTVEEFSFCMWKGSNALDVILMKYTTVGFAVILVFLTIFIVRCCCIRLRMFHTPNSVLIQSLSAFFILSYSQCARTTFHLLNYFCLYSKDQECENKIVYRVGYMTYFKGDHTKYAILAVMVLLFMVILPPLVLVIYPLGFKVLSFFKLSESKLTALLWRVMPIQLLDAFQSSFKDEYRFFAGLYFLYRALILGAFAYSRTLNTFYVIVQMQLTLAIALHSLFQPYKSRRNNIVDALLFTNLAFINGITMYNYSGEAESGLKMSTNALNGLALLQAFLISLPLLIIVVIGLEKAGKAYRRWRKRKKIESDERLGSLPPLREEPYERLP